jgi:dCTP diphosphatase
MKSTATSNSKTDAQTSLQDIKDTVATYLAERGWDHLEERSLAVSIAIEAAELLEHYQWGNDYDHHEDQAINDELADVLTYCIEFALARNINIAETFYDKLERVKQKYPTTTFNPSTAGHEAYHKAKQAYRDKKSQS